MPTSIAHKPWRTTGERIDTFFKQAVERDAQLESLNVTPRFVRGPDVFRNPSWYDSAGTWWDVTTPRAWQPHVVKYGDWGVGIGLFYGGF